MSLSDAEREALMLDMAKAHYESAFPGEWWDDAPGHWEYIRDMAACLTPIETLVADRERRAKAAALREAAELLLSDRVRNPGGQRPYLSQWPGILRSRADAYDREDTTDE